MRPWQQLQQEAPVRSPWRWLAVAAALTALASHVPITREHLAEAPYLGVLFIVLEVACLVLAVLLPTRDTRSLWLAAVATGVLAVAAYVLSRSVGLPQIGDDVGNWTEPLGYVAVASEVVLAAVGLAALGGRGTATRRSLGALPAVLGAAALVVGLVATVVAADSSPEMSEHALSGPSSR